MGSNEIALPVLALAELRNRVGSAYAQSKATFEDALDPGTRLTAKSPLSGVKLGSVWVTDPDPVATVTDRAALDTWLGSNYPEKLTATIVDMESALEVLREHAPELVAATVPDYVRNEVVKASDKAGAPIGPGGELDVPGVEMRRKNPVVSQRLAPEASGEIEALVREGYIDPTSGELRQIEAGGQ